MKLIAIIATSLVALLHLYIMCLEMFLWNTPKGRKTFGLTAEFAKDTRALAANQGLYNGFLAVGLTWGIWLGPAGTAIILFFLGCITMAGVFGSLTASRKILFVQALPALVALILVLIANRPADLP